MLSLADAVALVERVRADVTQGARESLEALANAVPVPIGSIALRACPELPPTIEEWQAIHQLAAAAALASAKH